MKYQRPLRLPGRTTIRCLLLLLAASSGSLLLTCPATAQAPLAGIKRHASSCQCARCISGFAGHPGHDGRLYSVPPFFGYQATCWQPWPEGWIGCPVLHDKALPVEVMPGTPPIPFAPPQPPIPVSPQRSLPQPPAAEVQGPSPQAVPQPSAPPTGNEPELETDELPGDELPGDGDIETQGEPPSAQRPQPEQDEQLSVRWDHPRPSPRLPSSSTRRCAVAPVTFEIFRSFGITRPTAVSLRR